MLAESQENDYKSSQAHRLSLESPRVGQTELDMLLPSPQHSHSQPLLTRPLCLHQEGLRSLP